MKITVTAFVVVLSFAFPATGQTLTGTISVESQTVASRVFVGYQAGIYGSMNPTDFVYDGNDHEVIALYGEKGGNYLQLSIEPVIARDLPYELVLPSRTIQLSTARSAIRNDAYTVFVWTDESVDWSVGDQITVTLRPSADPTPAVPLAGLILGVAAVVVGARRRVRSAYHLGS